ITMESFTPWSSLMEFHDKAMKGIAEGDWDLFNSVKTLPAMTSLSGQHGKIRALNAQLHLQHPSTWKSLECTVSSAKRLDEPNQWKEQSARGPQPKASFGPNRAGATTQHNLLTNPLPSTRPSQNIPTTLPNPPRLHRRPPFNNFTPAFYQVVQR
ncbi:MAG: hypothetical protein ACREP9_23545, partial [Candidatus Dormibacteraceae bacterium]